MDLQASLHLSTAAPHVFLGMGVKDPYERLGLEKNVSENKVEVVEKCLLKEFGSHKENYKSIEAVYDAIMIEKVSDDYTMYWSLLLKVQELTSDACLKNLKEQSDMLDNILVWCESLSSCTP